MNEWLSKATEYLAIVVFNIKGVDITVGSIFTFAIVLFGTLVAAALVRRGLRRALNRKTTIEKGRAESFGKLSSYLIYVLGVITAFHIIGIDMSSLLAAGAIFGVAIGFAMQTVVQNFVSGIILMVESSVHPGDIIEVHDEIARVEDIRIRSTIVRTLFDEEIIVPNSFLVSNSLKNLTMSDSDYRIVVPVGVAYNSDLRAAEKALEAAAEAVSKSFRVSLREFGDSAVVFRVSVWIDDPWEKYNAQSDLMFEIAKKLHEAEVVIAFPQLDLHVDDSLLDAMRSKSN